jgi:hypothetical protein
MSILSIDLHSSKSTIRLLFHFENVTYETLDDIYCSKFSTGCNPHVLGWWPQPCDSSLQLDVGCPVIACAIPDAMLLPTYECFAEEVHEPDYDGLACPKYALRDSNPASWLAKEQKSRVCIGDRRLLLLNDEAWRCHTYTQALSQVGGCRNGGQQLVARRLWCTDHQLGCLVWWLNPAGSHERYTPKQLLSLHRKVQLAGCSLGYRLYFCVSKPSFGSRLHEVETCSRLTNGSCAMSLNSNHVVLSTMPNVFDDVDLPTVDV